MIEALEIFGWMMLAGLAGAAIPFAWSRMQARSEGRYRHPRRIHEADPNDIYTC